jgi:small subunit ribosomal protein S21
MREFKGLSATPRPNEPDEKFIKRFLRQVRTDGILQEAYQRRAYEKPSARRRRKSARARFNRARELGDCKIT